MRKLRYNKIAVISLCVIWLFFALPILGETEEEPQAPCLAISERYHISEGVVSLTLSVSDRGSLDALLAVLEYDREALSFSSAKGVTGEKMNFTCSLADTGQVRLLFDSVGTDESADRDALTSEEGNEGYEPLCVLDFAILDADATSVRVSSANAYYLSGGNVTETRLASVACNLRFSEKGGEEKEPEGELGRDEGQEPLYVGYQVGLDGRLRLVGTACISEGAGFRVRTVDCRSGVVNRFDLFAPALLLDLNGSSLTREEGNGKYFYACELPCKIGDGVYFLHLTPFCVSGGRRIEGKRHIYVIKNGKPIYLGM